jgi:hypothetical protein
MVHCCYIDLIQLRMGSDSMVRNVQHNQTLAVSPCIVLVINPESPDSSPIVIIDLEE